MPSNDKEDKTMQHQPPIRIFLVGAFLKSKKKADGQQGNGNHKVDEHGKRRNALDDIEQFGRKGSGHIYFLRYDTLQQFNA